MLVAGKACLILALAVCLYGIGASLEALKLVYTRAVASRMAALSATTSRTVRFLAGSIYVDYGEPETGRRCADAPVTRRTSVTSCVKTHKGLQQQAEKHSYKSGVHPR